MGAMASQITSLTIVYWNVYSGADQRRHQCSASLAFVRGIHRWPVNSPPQRANNAEIFSIWWRHHVISWFMLSFHQYASWLYAWKCRDGHEIVMVVENDNLMVFVAKGQYRVIWLDWVYFPIVAKQNKIWRFKIKFQLHWWRNCSCKFRIIGNFMPRLEDKQLLTCLRY